MAGQSKGPSLRASLTAAAERPRRSFFLEADDKDDLKYRALSDIIRAIGGKEAWHRGSKEAFGVVLRQAIDKLDETFPIDGSTYSGAPKRQAALILYGYADREIAPRLGHEHEPYTYGDYLRAAFHLIGEHLGERTRGRVVEQIRDDLTDILTAMAEEEITRRETLAAQSDRSTLSAEYLPLHDYVPRLELYAELDAARDESHIIGLVGDGGTGKSTLARRYVELHASDGSYIFADFRSDNDLAASLHDSFTRVGISTEGLSAQTSWLRLRDVFAAPAQWPSFVILDNIRNAEQRHRLGTLPSRVTFVVTTRDDRVLPRNAARIVVGDLSEEQATLAIRRKLPDVTEEELLTLELLRGRVLAIDIACSFMREVPDAEGRSRFLRVLEQHIAQTISRIAPNLEQPRPPLEALYVEILRFLESDRNTALAVRLLELEVAYKIFDPDATALMFIPHSGHREYYFVRDFVGLPADGSIFNDYTEFVYQEALKTLARFHIVQVGKRINSVFILDRYRIDMHPLTVEILSGLFSDCLPQRCGVLLLRYGKHVEKMISRYEEIISSEGVLLDDASSVWNELGAARHIFKYLGTRGNQLAPSESFDDALEYAEIIGSMEDDLGAAYGLTRGDADQAES